MKAILGFCFLLSCATFSMAQNELDQLRTSFADARQATFAPQVELDAKYEAQLDALSKKAQDSANLPLVVEIREEKARFRNETATGAAKDRINDPQLSKVREVYVTASSKLREERSKSWDTLYSGYAKKLTVLRDVSTKAGRIDEALKADEEIKRIEKEIAALAASAPASKKPTGADANDHPASLGDEIVGEWQYRDNGRTWRRIFGPDGKVELWLEGNRDGAWLSDLHWKAEKRGIVTGAWIYKGEKEVTRLKLKDGGKVMKWEGGPEMVKVGEPKDFWKKK
jgi:hypothetical protein